MLGLGNKLSNTSTLVTPGIVTDSLVMKHMYPAGAVQPLSDGAAYFDGSGGYIEIATGALDISTTDFSFTAWIMPISGIAEYDIVFAKRDSDSDGFQFDLRGSGGAATFGGAIDDDDTSAVSAPGTADSVSENKWHHVSASVDRSDKITFFLDGVLTHQSGSITAIGATVESNSPFVIGAKKYGSNDGLANHFVGYICNVGLWSRTLTQAEVKSIMWKGYSDLITSESTSIVGWWALDEGTGTTATDATGNNNGTLTST